ncbi:competence/damage-inducible protein A [Irregularibacter muris]|uniref:Putative competence-damage inducible protein n=1 Tax=Irregularibacter muris TaxID=1796619 RepID=A0AAE3HCY5_9FIRM|nr:competence/damage-inducible protein A [Irregularibacter muris]MCR1898090.1 competence/damage-inducible protein A [Irregularibacter muris]
MNGEIICIGTEILLGDTLNTNSKYLSQELSHLGINVFYHSVVGDNPERLESTIELALQRSDIIIATGGLGPTQDDLTKETFSHLLKIPLVPHHSSLEHIQAIFNCSHSKMTENNIKQSYIPLGSTPIPNDKGTAPGVIIEKDDKVIILLPGPPKEMKHMFSIHVKPFLAQKTETHFFSRYYRIIGVGESTLESELMDIIDKQYNPTIATYAGNHEVLLRLTANADSQEQASQILQPFEDIIMKRMGENIYGGKNDLLETIVGKLLLAKNRSFSIAESCTGGLVASKLTKIPDISKVFHSGVVCYSNDAKENIIGVSPETIEKYGAVSAETAKELCQKLFLHTKTDIVMAITGIAGPGGSTETKPVGLVYIGMLYKGDILVKELRLRGDREDIQERAAKLALNLLREKLNTIV